MAGISKMVWSWSKSFLCKMTVPWKYAETLTEAAGRSLTIVGECHKEQMSMSLYATAQRSASLAAMMRFSCAKDWYLLHSV